ncbi:MAG: hypothetical protein L6R40_001403 [Gallowayella cf. fulva]|nr:MAG: hypothetical protein L6R40_001403 [Xanthomendoza cf. fulva]
MSDDTKPQVDPQDDHLDRPEPPAITSAATSSTDVPTIDIQVTVAVDHVSDEKPPPLPPRAYQKAPNVGLAGIRTPSTPIRPRLQATATTAVSRTDIHTQSFQDGSRETYAASKQSSPPSTSWAGWSSIRRLKVQEGSESASIRSYAPTLDTGADVESLLGGFLGQEQTSGWNILNGQLEETGLQQVDSSEDDGVLLDFDQEFDEIGGLDSGDTSEGNLQQ